MVIIDTTVWIDYLRGLRTPETIWLHREMDLQPIGLTDMILCEVLQGIRRDEIVDGVRARLLPFAVFDSGGERMAVAAAANYRLLRTHGHTVRKTIDCLIATFCIVQGYTLLHHDRDFDAFEKLLGLKVVSPRTI